MYILSVSVPYEGMCEVFQGDWEQCKWWLENDRPRYGYDLDDITVYIEGPDVRDVLYGSSEESS